MVKKIISKSGKSPVKTRTHYSNEFKHKVIMDGGSDNNAETARKYNLDRRLVSKWRLKYVRFWEKVLKTKDNDARKISITFINKVERLEDRIYALTH